MTRATARGSTAVTTTAAAATLAVAAAAGVVAVRQMDGMDMGPATDLGPLGFFAVAWVSMMAAMMLPGAVPAVVRQVRAEQARGVPLFLGSYLAVWVIVGVPVFAGYRPHGPVAAGAMVIAAGCYELTPLKQRFRRHCREQVGSGLGFGLVFGVCCVGSSIGLMVVLLALGAMSGTWTCVVAALVLAQKVVPSRPVVDIPVALAILGLGVWVVLAPGSVPAFPQPM